MRRLMDHRLYRYYWSRKEERLSGADGRIGPLVPSVDAGGGEGEAGASLPDQRPPELGGTLATEQF